MDLKRTLVFIDTLRAIQVPHCLCDLGCMALYSIVQRSVFSTVPVCNSNCSLATSS